MAFTLSKMRIWRASEVGSTTEVRPAVKEVPGTPSWPQVAHTATWVAYLYSNGFEMPTEYNRPIYAEVDRSILSLRIPGGSWRFFYSKLRFEPQEAGDVDGVAGTVRLVGVAPPYSSDHAATKGYVDDLVGDIASLLDSINGEVV